MSGRSFEAAAAPLGAEKGKGQAGASPGRLHRCGSVSLPRAALAPPGGEQGPCSTSVFLGGAGAHSNPQKSLNRKASPQPLKVSRAFFLT